MRIDATDEAERLGRLLDEAASALREGRPELVLDRVVEFDSALRRLPGEATAIRMEAGAGPPGSGPRPGLAAHLPVLRQRVDALLEQCRGASLELSAELESLRTLSRFRQDAETRPGAWLNRDA